MEEKKNVLAVCINNTYKNGNDRKESTIKSWRVGKNKLSDIEYIVGVCHKKIETVYKVKGSKKTEDSKRIDFIVDKEETEIKEKIKDKFNNNIRFYGPIRYLHFDLTK